MLMSQDLEQSSLTDSPMTERQKKIVGRPKTSASDDDEGENKNQDVPIPFLGGIMGSGKAKPSEQEKIFAPRKADVLLGRGKPFQSHLGNQRMLCLVDEYRNRYLQSERREKHAIVESVMKTISDSGGRFLIRVDYENYWVEVKHSIAYRKVGHAFRSKARRKGDNTGPLEGASIIGDDAAPSSSSDFLGGPIGYTGSMMTSGNLAAAQRIAPSGHHHLNDLLLLGGGPQSLPAGRSSALRLPIDSPDVSTSASHLQLLGVGGMNSPHAPQNASFASLPLQGPYASGDIGPRIPYPPPRLAAMGGLQLSLTGQGSGAGLVSLPGAAAGVSNFGSTLGGGGLGLPANTVAFDPSASMIYHQRQQQQILAQQEELILQEQAALRAKLARVQFLESLRRQQQHDRDQRNQNW